MRVRVRELRGRKMKRKGGNVFDLHHDLLALEPII